MLLTLLIIVAVLWLLGWCVMHPLVTGKAIGKFCLYLILGCCIVAAIGYTIWRYLIV